MKRVLTALAAVFLVSCGSTPSPAAAPTATPDTITGAINVFAAASLTAAFKDEGTAFQTKHPNATVTFNFAGSTSLVASINNGAPADVFASADQPNMDKIVNAGNATSSPANFATNKLQIVVPPSNPKGIKGLADLANPGTVVILCAPAVPCGNYANQALTKAGVKVTPKSQEQDVNAVVSKVSLGEADAGIVYVTDVKAAGALDVQTRHPGQDVPAHLEPGYHPPLEEHAIHGGDHAAPHESPWVMVVPLLIIVVPACIAGWIGIPGLYNPFAEAIHFGVAGEESLNYVAAALGLIAGLLGIGLAWVIYVKRVITAEAIAGSVPGVYRTLYNKYYFDEAYQWVINHVVLGAAGLAATFDRKVINDGVVDAPAHATAAVGARLRFLETGRVYSYAFVFFVGVLLVAVVMAGFPNIRANLW